ncbi:MAG: Ig-like domain-containing protein [Thermoplasmatota archaeon]
MWHINNMRKGAFSANRKILMLLISVLLVGSVFYYLPEGVNADIKPGGTLKNDQPARIYTQGWWWAEIPDELQFKVPTKTNHYTAVAIDNRAAGEDFDLFLYNDYEMTQRIGYSTKGSDVIDFVVVDGSTYTGAFKYAKVIKFTGQDWTDGIRIESDYHTVAADLYGSDPDANGYLEIGERRYSMFEYHGTGTYSGTLRGDLPVVNMYSVYLDSGGTYDFSIYSVPAGEQLSMYLLKGSGSSDDALAYDTASAGGSLNFNFQPELSGYYGLCVIDENQGYTSVDNYTLVITSDFGMTMSPSSKLIGPGMNATYMVDVSSLGVTKDIDLTYRWQNSAGVNISTPAGASATLNVVSINVGGVGNKTAYLNVTTTGSMSAGTYYLAVYGTDTGYNGHTRSTQAILRVSTYPDFFMSATPDIKVISPGTAAGYTISMETINSFSSNVDLSASIDRSASYFNLSFSPTHINNTNPLAYLTVNTLPSAPIGLYNITISGTGGSLTRYANVTLRVKEPIRIEVLSPNVDEIVSGVYTFKVRAGSPTETKAVRITFGGKMQNIGTLNMYYNSGTLAWERVVNTFNYPDGLCWFNITAEDHGGGITISGPYNFTLSNSAPNPIINTPVDRSYATGTSMPISVNTTSIVVSCRFRVDENAWIPLTRSVNTWTGTYDTSRITDGQHTLTVEAKDSAGLTGLTTITIFVDNTRPTCNINSPINGQYIEGAYIFRVVATDLVGVKKVDISIFGENITLPYNPITSSYEYTLTTSNKPDGTYQVMATAYDNVNLTQSSSTIVFHIDNNAPSMNIVKPMDDEIIGGHYNVQITSSDTFFNRVEYMVDSTGWQPLSGSEPNWNVVLNTSLLTDGDHTLSVRAFDNSSHMTEKVVDFIVDNTNPTCNVIAPFEGAFLESVYTFKISSIDVVGIDSVVIDVFGMEYQTSLNRQNGYYEYSFNTLTIVDGTYNITATSKDLSGKVTDSALVNFKVDNEAPEITLVGLQTGNYVSGLVLFNVTVNDPFLRDVRYSVDGGEWALINQTWNTMTLLDGKHTVRIQARDQAGHQTTQALDLIIDNNLPVCAVNSPVSGEYIDGAYTFKISASDSVGIEKVEIFVFGTNFSTSYSSGMGYFEYTTDTSIRTDGLYSCYAIVHDKSGKRNTSVMVTFQIDNNAPDLMVSHPIEGAFLEGLEMMNTTATDVFLDKVEYNIDGAGWVGVGTALNTTLFGDGTHRIVFRATDKAGHMTTTTISVKIDNNNPTGSITAPVVGQFLEGAGLFTALASDTVGIEMVTITVFGATLVMSYNSGTGNYEYRTDTRVIPDGTYSFNITIKDISGKTINIGPRTFYIDNNVPVLRVNSPTSGDYLEGIETMDVNATDVFLDRIEYDMDGTGWIAIDVPLNTTLFSDGNHKVNFRVIDKAGHTTSSFVNVVIDNTLPTGTIGFPGTNQYVEGTFIFTATASDLVGIRYVNILVFNNTLEMNYNSGTGSYEYRMDTRLIPDGTYQLYAVVMDLSGKSILIGPRTFFVDNHAPVLSVIHPAAWSYLEGLEDIQVNATDVFLDRIEYNVDDTGWVPLNMTFNTTVLSDGTHTIVIRAMDKAGHATSSTVNVVIDNTAPYGAINSPVEYQFIQGIYLFKAVASDIVGIKSVNVGIFNTTLDMNYNSGTGYYEYQTDTSLTPDGNYSIMVYVTDLSGKSTIVGPRYFQIDNHYPKLEIYNIQNGIILSGSHLVNYSVNDTFLKSVEYEVDNKGFRDISIPFDTTLVEDGDHTIKISANDWSGKSTVIVFNVKVDNLGPICTINSPVEGEFVEGIVTIRVSAFDVVGIDHVLIKVYDLESRVPYNPLTGYYEYTSNTVTWGAGEDGVRNVTATVYDLTGKSFTHGPVFFNVDNRPPTININSPQDGEVVSDLFFFDVENGDVFKKGTEYNIDGASWQPVSIGWNTDLVNDGLHKVTIRATDRAGHVTLETLYVYVDNNPPEISLASPAENEFVEGTYTFRVSAFDEVGITRVTMNIDQIVKTLSYNTQSGYYEYIIDTRTLADGTYSINATALDMAGRLVTTKSLEFRVDNKLPELMVESPVKDQLISGIFVVRATTMDEFPGAVRYAIDGTTWYDVTTPWNSTLVNDGYHTISVKTEDRSGHQTIFHVNVVVDNSAPVISQTSLTPGQPMAGLKTIRFYAYDAIGIGEVMLSIDGTSPFEIFRSEGGLYYEYILDTRTLSDGDHTIAVTAYDRAGNHDGSTYGIKVDNSGPEISLDYYWIEGDEEVRIGEVKEGNSVVFRATVIDPSGVSHVMINIDSQGWREMAPDSNESNPDTFILFWPTSGSEGGAHVFQIMTADKLGNEATKSGMINVKEKKDRTTFGEWITSALPFIWLILFILLVIAIGILAYFGILTKWARGEGRVKKEKPPVEEGELDTSPEDIPETKRSEPLDMKKKKGQEREIEEWEAEEEQ